VAHQDKTARKLMRGAFIFRWSLPAGSLNYDFLKTISTSLS